MNRIRTLRRKQHLKQSELAKLVNIDQRKLSNLETGYSSLHVDDAIKLANFFNVSLDYLTGRTKEQAHVFSDKDIETINAAATLLNKIKNGV